MNNPFKKHEAPKNQQTDDKYTPLLVVNSAYQIDNKTEGPDQLLSIVTMLIDYSVSLVSEYAKRTDNKELDYDKIVSNIVSSLKVYRLVNSGMDPEEAIKVLDLKAKIHDIPPRNP